jgi:hypothetical protein
MKPMYDLRLAPTGQALRLKADQRAVEKRERRMRRAPAPSRPGR